MKSSTGLLLWACDRTIVIVDIRRSTALISDSIWVRLVLGSCLVQGAMLVLGDVLVLGKLLVLRTRLLLGARLGREVLIMDGLLFSFLQCFISVHKDCISEL